MSLTPIHHTFGPLADWRQCLRALGLILLPWRLLYGRAPRALTRELSRAFQAEAILFASGREGLYALLKVLNLPKGSEVIVQAYTCVVVPNAIHRAGCTPVYAEIERDTLNLDVRALEALITPRTRAIICQHTFGIPADAHAIRKICSDRGLLFIEDCAHVLPDAKGPNGIGMHGDFALLSFGRDKAISGVSGGAMLSRKPDVTAALQSLLLHAPHLPFLVMLRLMLYPLLYTIARPLYGLGLGKALLAASRKLHLLLPIVDDDEKIGRMSGQIHRLPNACAALALAQWRRLQAINDHRRMLTRLYLEKLRDASGPYIPKSITADLPLQKFPIFVSRANAIRKHLKKRNIHLDDGWTGCVVCPASVTIEESGYRSGTDPVAEEVCEGILSLPTHPGMTMKQARRLVEEALLPLSNSL